MRGILLVALLAACAKDAPEGGGGHDHGHVHAAPHGGALVALGDEFAHLEAVADAAAGRLTLYVLDGHAQKGVRLPDASLRCTVRPAGFPLELLPVARATTGETAGDASEFSATDPRLEGLERFTLVVERVAVKGREFSGVEIPVPEGDH